MSDGGIQDIITLADIRRLMEAMRRTKYDFRSTRSLAAELRLSERQVRAAMCYIDARRPMHPRGGELDLWRLTDRGYTRRERWRMFLHAMAGEP